MSGLGLRHLFIGIMLALAMAAPACARDRIVVALQLEPPTLDPTSGAAAAIKEVTYRNIFEGLTTLDATGAAVPLLATSWTMAPDAKSYVFHLRPNVRFQDGTSFDARVVAFSLMRAIRPGSTNAQAEALSEIAGVDMIDPLTVRIRLNQHYDLTRNFFLGGIDIASPGRPRSFGVRGRYSF